MHFNYSEIKIFINILFHYIKCKVKHIIQSEYSENQKTWQYEDNFLKCNLKFSNKHERQLLCNVNRPKEPGPIFFVNTSTVYNLY